MLGTVSLWDRSPATLLPGTFVRHKVKATCPGLCLIVLLQKWHGNLAHCDSFLLILLQQDPLRSRFQGPPEVEDLPQRVLEPWQGAGSLVLSSGVQDLLARYV